MRVRLEYGKSGLEVNLPDKNVIAVLNLKEVPSADDPAKLVREALRRPIESDPLRTLAHGKSNPCIVVCDVTRPVPNPIILPEILDTLNEVGIADGQVTILIATGTHRGNTEAELLAMLGPRAVQNCSIINHDCTATDETISFGTSPNGVPIAFNRHYVDADLRITVGMIEPHFMAGFAGGRKMVMPGIAALESIQTWHSPAFLEHPQATNGSVHENPVHLEATWIANRCRPDFIVDVALDKARQITRVFAGDMEFAWLQGVEFVTSLTQDEVPEPVDICVTTCGGHPLDLTFYQTVKGIVGPLPILKPGGTIIVASECSEGIGNAHFREALLRVGDIRTWLERELRGEWERVADQWQIEELAKAARNHPVYVVCRGIPEAELAQLHVTPAASVEKAVEESLKLHGPDAKICVIPKGPYIIPVLPSPSDDGERS